MRLKHLILLTLFSLLPFLHVFGGSIIYPWNATTAIVKAGESFEIWFNADEGETVQSVALQGPYNKVKLTSFKVEEGCWVYDAMSGKTYNRTISLTVPEGTPKERYDLHVSTSEEVCVSPAAVKVIFTHRSTYTVFHVSDTHLCDESDRAPGQPPFRLNYLSALVELANIIGPEIAFVTGDNVNSRSRSGGDATYLDVWPSTQERVDYFYRGDHRHGLLGVHDFDAAAFTVNGNHDHYERPADCTETKNKFAFWNTYHGLRTHHFTYGNARFMAFSDAFGEDHNVQAARHDRWLDQVGDGNLKVVYKHIYTYIPDSWFSGRNIQFGMCGHNHHIGPESPYPQDGTDMYIVNFTQYTTFNLFTIHPNGQYSVLNNAVAIENPEDDPSDWKPKLTLSFDKPNDGRSAVNTAILTNRFDTGFPEARIRFLVPKGAMYTITKGTVEQQFEGDTVCVVDVRVEVRPNSETTVRISRTGVPHPTLSRVRYGDHERQILDLWKADSDGPTPLVFVIHGGGWQGGSKERINRFVDVQKLLDEGISVAAINYRYLQQAVQAGISPPVRAPLYDAARALQFVRSHADEWNIDKELIGATGGSAGACSSLWLAYHDDLIDPESQDPVARESSRLHCAAVIGAQTTLDPKQAKEWIPNITYGGQAFGKRNFQEFLAERKDLLPWIKEYSPYALVSADDPPVFLQYSAPPAVGEPQENAVHSANFGVQLKEKCDETGIGCEVAWNSDTDTRIKQVTDYLIDHLTIPSE
jgi:acetyl esterase/lipase